MSTIKTAAAALVILTVGGTASAHAQDQGRGRGRGRGHDEQQQQQDQRAQRPVTAEEQARRVQEEQQRSAQYRQQMDQRVRAAQEQAARLQAQNNRAAQYRAQQQYAAQLAEQQRRLQAQRDYRNDPYVTTPHSYRYVVAGNARQTNQYGVDVLKQAVNYGYQQGVNAGAADRQDHYRSSYSASPIYRDANYGYNGNYISQSDYNYYFRQGFQRGYSDGYGSRTQYGTTSNNTTSILGNLLTSILGLQPIR